MSNLSEEELAQDCDRLYSAAAGIRSVIDLGEVESCALSEEGVGLVGRYSNTEKGVIQNVLTLDSKRLDSFLLAVES